MCEHEEFESNLIIPRIILSTILFACAFKFNILFYFAYIIVAYDIVFNALKRFFKGDVFDENFLMTIASIGAICIKELPEAVAVMLLYQIGEFLQDKAVDKSRDSIAELMDIRPDYANLVLQNEIKKVNPQEVKIDDVILVKAGEKIPLDGIVIDGNSQIDTSSLTGESLPQSITVGQNVNSGCINLSSTIKIKVKKIFAESTVSQILKMVEDASNKKTKTENFITKFAQIYTPFVVVLALFIAFIPPFFVDGNWIERALTFLVISCPCALVISVPLGFFAGIGAASKAGILVKGSIYLEKLSRIKTVVFDKTGTLTKGDFEVIKINSTNPNILKYAAFAESASNHPIAKAIKNAYGKNILPQKVTEISGKGVKAIYENKEILVGNSEFIGVEPLDNSDGTVVYVKFDNEYIGNIVISDTIKETSFDTISNLNNKKINTAMLTGDTYIIALKVQKELNINKIYAQLLPNQKVEKLEEIMQNNKGVTLFVGDGINDAPVLTRADIGVAMGGMGSDAAIEAADIVIMDDNPQKLIKAMKISQNTMKIVKQNIVFALGVKVLFLILSAFGLMTMWGAIFADVGVTLIAVINSLRVLKIKI